MERAQESTGESGASHTVAAVTALAGKKKKKKEPFCGVNTNSIMLELLEEFYNPMEKNGRKGTLVFLFQRESQHFETWAQIHRGIYLGV